MAEKWESSGEHLQRVGGGQGGEWRGGVLTVPTPSHPVAATP